MLFLKDGAKIWIEFPGCVCLKHVLCQFGYDNVASLKCLTETNIIALEQEIDRNRKMIEGLKLKCNHIQNYKVQEPFRFLPGHKQLLLDWCKCLGKCITSEPSEEKFAEHSSFQPILREMILSSISNYNKAPNIRRFSTVLMEFSTYLYILAGRQCYEVLASNLPLPKAGTVGKFQLYLDLYYSRLIRQINIFFS